MTYWADNIRFIKDVQDSKYAKIEEAIEKVSLLAFLFIKQKRFFQKAFEFQRFFDYLKAYCNKIVLHSKQFVWRKITFT